MPHEKVHIKIGKMQIVVFLAIFGAIAAGVFAYIEYGKCCAPIFTADFEGQTLGFRADLREAQKVEVIPDEGKLYSQIVRPPRIVGPEGQVIIRKPLRNVTIAFKQVSQGTMGWYTVEASEIIKKLTALYKGKYDVDLNFAIAETDDYDELKGSNTAPIIALVHPEIADGTFVSVDDDRDVITISGGDSLRDFDRATVKFLMVALGVSV